jgi:hypothetical protein
MKREFRPISATRVRARGAGLALLAGGGRVEERRLVDLAEQAHGQLAAELDPGAADFALGGDGRFINMTAFTISRPCGWRSAAPNARDLQASRPLMKTDPLCVRLETDVGRRLAYGLSKNVGSRPQPTDALRGWIRRQRELFDSGGVAAINALPQPHPTPKTRSTDFSRRVWRVTAQITQLKAEGDSDIHLVLFDAGAYLIAEMPAPQCVPKKARDRKATLAARKKFITGCGQQRISGSHSAPSSSSVASASSTSRTRRSRTPQTSPNSTRSPGSSSYPVAARKDF